jgi:hexokinase
MCMSGQAAELPVLEEDRQLDEESNNPGQQRFEKLTAGLYMGDIARRIILR